MRVLAFVKTAPALVLLLREIVQQKKKKAESHCISHNQRGPGGRKEAIFPTKSVYIHYFAIFFSLFKGNLLSAAK